MQMRGLSSSVVLREDDMLGFVFLLEFQRDSIGGGGGGGDDEDGERTKDGKECIYTFLHSLSNISIRGTRIRPHILICAPAINVSIWNALPATRPPKQEQQM